VFSFLKEYKKSIFIVGGFILGFSVSGGLLLYSGKELVNLFVYLAFVVIIPALLSIFTFVSYLFFRGNELKAKSIKLSMLGGVFYSLGALISLILTISTKDIAFGWATTLNINSTTLKSILDSVAIWKSFCSSCVASNDLIEISRYNRLGSSVSKEQIEHALMLGQWWKFLAMSIVVYGIFLRAFFYLLTVFISKKSEAKIVIASDKNRDSISQIDATYDKKISINELKNREFRLIGYHIDTSNLNLTNSKDAKDIVVVVKSWEPPILDFFDYLEELQEQNPNSKITIYLVGLNGKAIKQDIDIWIRKIKELKQNYEVVV